MDLKRLKNYAKQASHKDELADRALTVRVVGVTFEGRQDLLAAMHGSTPIKLERDRRNTYDFYAVKVVAQIDGEWKQVGFIPKKMSRKVSYSIDNGLGFDASVQRLSGGGKDYNYGLDILINLEG